jgi:hypothetical protein
MTSTPSSKRINNRKTPGLQAAELDDLEDSYVKDSQREDSRAASCGTG